jgi:hypothetical protein
MVKLEGILLVKQASKKKTKLYDSTIWGTKNSQIHRLKAECGGQELRGRQNGELINGCKMKQVLEIDDKQCK